MMKWAPFLCFLCAVSGLPAQTEYPGYVVKDRVLVKYQGSERNVEIPPKLGIDRIGERAFMGVLVYTVKVPMGVAFIDEQAFVNCSFLKSVSLPNTLLRIGRRAFLNCISLETVNIPISLEAIGDGAFLNCRSLKEIDIPDAVKTIGSSAFSGCLGLEKISLSRRTKQGKHPFMGVRLNSIVYRD